MNSEYCFCFRLNFPTFNSGTADTVQPVVSRNPFCVLYICFPTRQVAKSISPTKSLGLVHFPEAFFLNMQWATNTFSHIRIQSPTHLVKQNYIKEITCFFHCILASHEQINIWRINKYKEVTIIYR